MKEPKRAGNRRTRWTASDAKAVLAEWEASGLSLAAFGRERGIAPLRLTRWRKQLGSGALRSIIPVTSGGMATIRVDSRGMVVETTRFRVEVFDYDPVAADWIARLVRATETTA